VPTHQEAFFLPVDDGRDGQRFCLFHPAHGARPLGAIVYVHPFAEEMNKSRRMAALQSRALAQAGYAVLQIDLLGCGDSSGDFGDATWQGWVDDVARGCHWLRARSDGPLWLWGLRAGCLLAAEASRQLPESCNFIFWAPTPAGKTVWQQFMRLKVAGDLLSGNSKGILESLRQQLAAGQSIEIAGYPIAPALAQGLEQSALAAPAGTGMRRLEWLDMSTREDAALSPVAQKAIEQWMLAGFTVQNHWVNGPAFWQTAEIEDAPALLMATVHALAGQPATHQRPAAVTA